VVSQLKELVVTSRFDHPRWTLVPLSAVPSASHIFEEWAAGFHELGVKVAGPARGSRFGSKAMLYRQAACPEVPSAIELIDPDIQVGCAVLPTEPLQQRYAADPAWCAALLCVERLSLPVWCGGCCSDRHGLRREMCFVVWIVRALCVRQSQLCCSSNPGKAKCTPAFCLRLPRCRDHTSAAMLLSC
jgi:hypothetical protein